MSIQTVRGFHESVFGGVAAGRYGMLIFAATLLLSASLLFSVQPLFAKMVLPHLGGSPSVWAVAMCFFQAALLAGYCYAHALNRFVSAAWAPFIHLFVCGIAVFTLPFGLPEWANEVPAGNQYFWLIGVLAVGVGLPFFAVSANAPLLQAWFARSGHVHADDPYFLYGASNLGSLASLLAYPFLIEPMLGLDAQRSVWAGGYYFLMFALLVCGLLMLAQLRRLKEMTVSADDAVQAGAARGVDVEPVTAARRMVWIALAFVPSALLVAFTTHITTDIASAPFLWVIPLATFLGTFVIVFREKSLIPDNWMLAVHPFLVAASLVMIAVPNMVPVMVQGAVGFATFVVTTLVCHRVLYHARPEAAKLTEFYLYMSLGGVLGGMFAALIAPQLFNTVAEYPVLIVCGLFARPQVFQALMARVVQKDALVVAAAVVGMVIVLMLGTSQGFIASASAKVGVAVATLVCAISIALFVARPAVLVKAGVGAMTLFLAASSISVDGYSERSFFGVSRVIESADGRYRLLIHGSTIHGGEQWIDENGKPTVRPPPIMYYYPGAPMARGFAVARAGLPEGAGPLRVGVIGLGTGSLACHLKGRETIRFYEIDSVVDSIARDPKHFRYISRCAPETETVLGDARLTLSKSPDKSYDYFVVDAFSSDAVPVHLLTREALSLYLSKLSDTGVLAFHISNRHLELESVVAATAKTLPGVSAAAVFEPNGLPGLAGNPSHVVFLAKDQVAIERVLKWKDARAANARETRAWSDNYADILSALWRRYVD